MLQTSRKSLQESIFVASLSIFNPLHSHCVWRTEQVFFYKFTLPFSHVAITCLLHRTLISVLHTDTGLEETPSVVPSVKLYHTSGLRLAS